MAIFQITMTKVFAHPGELIGSKLMIIPFMRIFRGNRKLLLRNWLPGNGEFLKQAEEQVSKTKHGNTFPCQADR